jgi:hypothetical protein
MSKSVSNFIYTLNRDWFTSYDTLLDIAFVTINAFNIFLNYQDKWKVSSITMLLVIIYFNLSRRPRQNKLELLFIATLFSIITSIVESTLIHHSGGIALKYGKTGTIMNIPVWLFCAYFSMVMIILNCQRYYWEVVIKMFDIK